MNSNASPSAFGWDFQTNAAIVLMIENIQSVVQIRVEGKLEDIELKLLNGNYIYSQAKSIIDREKFSNARAKLKKAIKTLCAAALNNNYEKLIYITNTPKPFGSLDTLSTFYDNAYCKYSDLPKNCQDVIQDLIMNDHNCNFDTSKFIIRILPFHTNNLDERYKVVKRIVSEFLYEIDSRMLGIGQKILDISRVIFLKIQQKMTQILL